MSLLTGVELSLLLRQHLHLFCTKGILSLPKGIFTAVPLSLLLNNLSIDGDVEKEQENEWEDAMDEEIEVDEIYFDIKVVESEGCWCNLLNL